MWEVQDRQGHCFTVPPTSICLRRAWCFGESSHPKQERTLFHLTSACKLPICHDTHCVGPLSTFILHPACCVGAFVIQYLTKQFWVGWYKNAARAYNSRLRDATATVGYSTTMFLQVVAELISAITLTILTACQGSYAGSVSLPSYPLAVKNPYLSAWVRGGQVLTNAATAQPEFWAGQDLTWSVLGRINGVTYSLFGMPTSSSNIKAAKTVGVTYTSSHTVIQLTAGNAKIELDFFSPVLPGTGDYARQSLPYSYLTVSISSNGGKPIKAQVLSAIDQTWTAQNGAAKLNYTTSGSAAFFQFHDPNEIPYTEVSDMATYGSVVFATSTGSGLSAGCDSAAKIYSAFAKSGTLKSASSCSGNNLAALSKTIGPINSKQTGSVIFAVGFDRPQAIDYLGNAQTGYYRSKWPTIPEAVEYFLGDYDSVLSTSNTFDQQVRSRSQAVSSSFGTEYADIVEASVRQTFGATELTVGTQCLFKVQTLTGCRCLRQISVPRLLPS